MTPSLTVDEMANWQSAILRFVGKLIGLKGNPYIMFIENEEFEPTINDLKRLHEEDEANSVRNNN